MIVSFDFDDTLLSWTGKSCGNLIAHAKKMASDGHDIIIVTARRQTFENHSVIVEFCKANDIPIKRVICVNHDLKGSMLKQAKADMHFDDDIGQCFSAIEHGIKCFLVRDDTFEELSDINNEVFNEYKKLRNDLYG